MGYTTTFEGVFSFEKEVDQETIELINGLNESR
jgi:hypothetical protein